MFFKDIEDFKKYCPVNASFELDIMAIYLSNVDRNILRKYIGKDLLSDIQTAFDATDTAELLNDPIKNVVELLRVASANFALTQWIVAGQVSFSQAGVHITSTETMKTAFQWQIKDIQEQCKELAHNALEDALAYLEENIDATEFESYKSSDEFKENNYLFVSSAADFCKYYSAFSNSRVNFFKLRSVIRRVEDFEIKSIILPDYFASLKATLAAGEAFGTNAQKIVDLIKPALVNLTIARGINDLSITINENGLLVFDNTGGRDTIDSRKNPSEQNIQRLGEAAKRDGENYRRILAKFIEDNISNYPLISGDSQYVRPSAKIDINATGKPFYTAL